MMFSASSEDGIFGRKVMIRFAGTFHAAGIGAMVSVNGV